MARYIFIALFCPGSSTHIKEFNEFGSRVTILLELIRDWQCEQNSALKCLNVLINNLVTFGILEEEAAYITGRAGTLLLKIHSLSAFSYFAELWISDLLHVGYADQPILRGSPSPCIGEDALYGVYYHPAVQYKQIQKPRNPKVRGY